MFICEDCLKLEHKWRALMMPSYGRCEDCHKEGACVDGPWELSKHSEPDHSSTTTKEVS